ncbi:hypothetical protein [Streptomyces sp. NPDC002187]|uniref:hypothetical protein n=1 Tax=Streptomyces sp. NPDC002187 TaxID=3364637 RepID=UPI0036B65E6F
MTAVPRSPGTNGSAAAVQGHRTDSVILDKTGRTDYEGVLPGGEGLAEKVDGLTG